MLSKYCFKPNYFKFLFRYFKNLKHVSYPQKSFFFNTSEKCFYRPIRMCQPWSFMWCFLQQSHQWTSLIYTYCFPFIAFILPYIWFITQQPTARGHDGQKFLPTTKLTKTFNSLLEANFMPATPDKLSNWLC